MRRDIQSIVRRFREIKQKVVRTFGSIEHAPAEIREAIRLTGDAIAKAKESSHARP